MRQSDGSPRALALSGALLLLLSFLPASGQEAVEEPGVFERALELAAADHAVDRGAAQAAVAALADRWRAEVGDDAGAARRAEAFASLLFRGEERFRSVPALHELEALHIDTVLQRRRGYCLSLSVVLLAVAETLGEPLHGVAAPNHFFVRFDDGEHVRNIELTRGGATLDTHEAKRLLGDALPDDTFYYRNLGPAEVAGCLLHNRGFVKMVAGNLAGARRDYEAALELAPELPEVHRNLGVLAGEKKDYRRAIAHFDRALSLFPGDVEALQNRALCHMKLEEWEAALADLEVAVLLWPDDDLEHMRAMVAERVQDRENGGGGVRALEDPPANLEPGLVAEYFRGVDFDERVVRRIDRKLDHDWQNTAPARGVPSDRFSARWRGWLRVDEPGKHTLFVVANDGIRVQLDGVMLLDNWRDMGYRNFTEFVDVELTAGWHRIQVEHYDQRGGARVMLRLGPAGGKVSDLEGRLFHEGTDR